MARRRKLKVETVPIEKLKPHPLNYKDHPDDQLDHIEAMLRAEGLYKNVVVAKDNTILAGHGVVKAASERLGWSEIEVERRPIAADSPRALRILAGDNEIATLGKTDQVRLLSVLRAAQDNGDALIGTGYDEKSLLVLSKALGLDEESQDASPQMGDYEYRVLVSCSDEQHQIETMAKLEKEGYTCQALIS